MNELISLPPGCTVKENSAVGYEFLDEHGEVLTYHPKDGNHIRRLVWAIWWRERRRDEETNTS